VKSLVAAIALVGATVYTGEGPPLHDATVVIDANRIQSVGTNVRPPDGAKVIDASGMVITPGFVAVATRVGTLDIELEPTSVEATLPLGADPVRAALRTADTYNPRAFTVPIARAGGITSALVVPEGGQISGQAAWVDLSDKDWLRRGSAALSVSIDTPDGPPGPPPAGVRAAAFLRLRETLTDARLYRANRGPFLSNKLRALSISAGDLEVLDRALARELIVLVEVNRASDIRTVVEIANEYGIRVVIVGGAEAWQQAALLAREQIPVVLDPFDDLPASLGELSSRPDAAAILAKAGVRVMLADLGSPHFAHRLRQAAGNAVASGLPYDEAIASLTSVPANVFGISDSGAIRAGAVANLVLWNGDPLEVTTWAERMWIRGQEVSLETRQDLLTERYKRETR
jgi:imidazolonepropionase-like amidohydrolase